LQHTWYHWKALELKVLTYNEKAIEYNNLFTENSFKSKIKLIWRFECALHIVGKPLMSRI
jgi:hypothetical protein